MVFDFTNPYGMVSGQPNIGPITPQPPQPPKAPNPMGASKNDKLGMMLYALGGALRGDKNFVENTMQLQNIQDAKKREKEQKDNWKKALGNLEGSVNPTLIELAKVVGPEKGAGLVASGIGTSKPETAGMQDYEFYKNLKTPEEKMSFLQATGRGSQSPELQKLIREAKLPGGVDVTPGQKKVDEDFAKTLVKWKTGERQQAESNITNLDNKLSLLTERKQNVSGTNIALTPDPLKPILFPEATGFLDEVSDIVFQSLRATLGAQFTEQEGKRLIAATFNQALPEEQNIPRLQRLSAKIKAIYNSKQNAIDYYNKKGTLVGYQEEPFGFDDILDSVLFDEFQRMSKEEILKKYETANTPEERQSILRFAKMLEKQG
jgi:hypothetical protein